MWNRDVDQSKYVLLNVNGNVVNRWRPIERYSLKINGNMQQRGRPIKICFIKG